MTLINKTKFLNDADFIIRLLYKYSYTSHLAHSLDTVPTLSYFM